MDKKLNSLLINYNRRVGQPLSIGETDLSGSITSKVVDTDASIRFPEHCIPVTGGAKDSSLNILSQVIYREARIHNMSLSPFGPLDPIKFVLAGSYIALIMLEAKRKIEAAMTTEFASTAFDTTLLSALGISSGARNVVMNSVANICKRYNFLCTKVNSMMIPPIGLISRWAEHRKFVFADDEGDRPHLYVYTLAGYYELIVDATDSRVGQLVYHLLDPSMTPGSMLDLASNLIDKLLSDTDFVNFSTEAMQAKMPTLSLKEFDYHITEDNQVVYKIPSLQIVYNLDDIMSLENAKFYEVVSDVTLYNISPTQHVCGMTIFEDPISNKLVCGVGDSYRAYFPSLPENTLPVFVPNLPFTNDYGPTVINQFPVTTHGKIKSVTGLTYLTRYIAGSANSITTLADAVTPFINPVVASHFDSQGYIVTSNVAIADFKRIVFLDVFSTEVLESPKVFVGALQKYTDVVGHIFYFSDSTALIGYIQALAGFKLQFNVCLVDDAGGGEGYDLKDYDYVFYLSSDSLQTFNEVNAYNDVQIAESSDFSKPSSTHSRIKVTKINSAEAETK